MEEENATPEPDETPERPDIPDFVITRTVGDMLAAERRRQGKSLGDIAAATRIRMRMLEALEEGAWETLPSSAYVKGYIQNYATALNLSAEPFLEAYRQEAPPDFADVTEPSPAMGGPIVPRRDQAHAIPPRLLLGVVAFFAVIGLIWLTLSLAGGSDTEPDPLPPVVEDQGQQSDPATNTPPGVTGNDSSTETPAEEPPAVEPFELVVSVAAGDVSWLRITVDGVTEYEGMLQGGDSRTYEVAELASVRIGRPSVVTITRDGEAVEIPSSSELPTVELSADD